MKSYVRMYWLLLQAVLSCDDCDDELLQSSIIIGIVIWLLLLTIFFIILVIILFCTIASAHPVAAGDAEPAAAPASVPARTSTGVQRREHVVARRLSSSRPVYAEPWMNTLAENVWKDYPLETIDDT